MTTISFPFSSSLAVALLLSLSSGCSSSSSEGTLDVRLYGESFVEDGITASDTVDGWAVRFDRFDATLENFSIAGVTFEDADAIDLSVGSDGVGHPATAATLPVGDHVDASFTVRGLRVSGTATLGEVTKTFDWALDAPTDYSSCEAVASVRSGSSTVYEISMHSDHLLYDSLVSDDPAVGFAPLAAADANEDGEITRAELEAADIGSLDAGSEGGIDDLWAWLLAQSRTLAHVDGEGHCDATER